MQIDCDGRTLNIGDKVIRVKGREHGRMKIGDIGIINGFSIKNNLLLINNDTTYNYDSKNYRLINIKKAHLPIWW